MPVQRDHRAPTRTIQRAASSGDRVTIHEAWDADHIQSLERRLLGAESDPKSHDFWVPVEEIARVLALSDLPLPPAIRRRLKAIASGDEPKAPPGPKPTPVMATIAREIDILTYHDRRRAQFERIKHDGGKAALQRAARRFGLSDVPATAATLGYEMTRRRFLPHRQLSSMANLITEIRARFP